ncbi:MAG TPA: HemK/PrmC family methyltransferase [Actinomycetota bacterium]|nr:HemK/PrmC family methyltransferase [Actinomycetota bacterium]
MANTTAPDPYLSRRSVARALAGAGSIAADAEAEELIAAAAGEREVLADLVGRRRRGEPVAWLTGAVTFCGLRIAVDPGVYVPRPWTETLAQRAASVLPPDGVAVDLGTGSGAIAAVLAAAAPDARVLATDVDPVAVACARRNGVDARSGSLDEPLPRELEGRIDVLTAVVPYVPTDDLPFLPRDVQAFEPRRALDGGADGSDVLREAARRAPRWLRPGGRLFLELGGDEAVPIGRLLRELGASEVEVVVDEDGDSRGVAARL